jgi:hypothetical protein
MSRASLAGLAAAVALAGPLPASGYDEPTHRLLTERAWPADLPRELAPAGPEDLEALRRAVWAAGAVHADAAVQARFLARWPSVRRFDAWAFKELLGLTPEAQVVGIDLAPGPELDPRAVAALGSRQPDDDRRNRDRFAHAPDRSVRRDAWGRPLPADPAQLDMGSLTGVSSQAYAHYGLPRLDFSEDPAVLRSDPRRFAMPRTVMTFAADFAQLHTDLALAAASLGTAGGRQLALTCLGQAEHYLEDVANQIHTLQAVYPFFVSAKLESVEEDLLTLGGLLGPRRGFIGIGVHIITNHHLFTEALWSGRVRRAASGGGSAEGQAGLDAIAMGDAALEAALDARALRAGGPFGREIAEPLIDASSREGAEVYLAARAVARRRLSTAAYEFADGGDPEADLSPSADPAQLARFYELQRNGFARAGTAVRRHLRLFREAVAAAGDSEAGRLALRRAALERLVAAGVAGLEARQARLAAWTPSPPARAVVDWRYPGGLAVLLGAALGGAAWLRRRRGMARRAGAGSASQAR